jgi:hypothetical protein
VEEEEDDDDMNLEEKNFQKGMEINPFKPQQAPQYGLSSGP